MKPEAKVVKAVLTLLRERGAKAIKTTPPGVESGTPDILACWQGLCLAIECKASEGMEPSPLQKVRLREWAAAGAVTMCVWSADQVALILDARVGAGGF